MTEIEKMKRYIKQTGLEKSKIENYSINSSQIIALHNDLDFFKALCMAFEYGQARGYRCAMVEVRK